jgi:CBS domain-containing protein
MKLEDVIEKAFLVRPDDILTQVTSKMINENRYEAFVFDGELKGVVTLDDIVRRRVSEPQKMKISYFIKKVALFSVETPVEDIINYMLVSEYRSLPVEKDGKIYAVTKPKLLKFVKDEIFESKIAKDVMQLPYCASVNDTLLAITSVMRDTGVNRIPVLDDGGRFVGLADSLSIAGFLTGRERAKFGERDGEKTKLGNIGISGLLGTNVIKVSPETSLKEIIKRLSDGGAYSVIVEDNGKFMGIITMKDVFKLIGKALETVYIRVSGLDNEDDFTKKKIDEMIENSIKKLLKMIKVTYVAINVERYKKKKRGERIKYSIHGRVVTDKGSFYANDYEWEPTKAMKMFLGKVERELHKHIEKMRGY